MLLKQASFLEGARGLAQWVAMQLDTTHRAADPAKTKQAVTLAFLLTLVIKAYFTDRNFECTNLAIQIYGGDV
jgi:alkylation response protein AidB-like acyl-CoA dehydrogenase